MTALKFLEVNVQLSLTVILSAEPALSQVKKLDIILSSTVKPPSSLPSLLPNEGSKL